MSEEQYKLLNERDLDQDVPGADEDKIRKKPRTPFVVGSWAPNSNGGNAKTTMMAIRLISD